MSNILWDIYLIKVHFNEFLFYGFFPNFSSQGIVPQLGFKWWNLSWAAEGLLEKEPPAELLLNSSNQIINNKLRKIKHFKWHIQRKAESLTPEYVG